MRETLKKYLVPLLLALIGAGLLLSAMVVRKMTYDAERVASKVEKKIEKRVEKLDAFASQMLQADPTSWTTLGKLPEDMVLYRYVCDTLQCWNNQFPVLNDDIRNKIRFQWINRPETTMNSPLNDIQEELCFVSLGSHWYLAKWKAKGELTEIIAAIEICTAFQEGEAETVNEKLGIPRDMLIYPVAGNPGATVKYKDKALFTLVSDSTSRHYDQTASILKWLALLAICAAALSLLYVSRRWTEFLICVVMMLGCYAVASVWGLQSESSSLFSPATYAGKFLWWSFGALGILNLLIFNITASLFMMRHRLEECTSKTGRIAHAIILALFFLGITVYTVFSVCDLMDNSNISMELRWFQRGILRSLLALVFYGLLLSSQMMLLYMLSPAIRKVTKLKLRFMNIASLSIGALLFSTILFGISAKMGFDKECSKVNVWANRLSVDRNLNLEMQILMVEEAIAKDEVIPMFADLPEATGLINRQITTSYFANIESEYDVVVSVCNHDDAECNTLFNSKLAGGTPVGPGSRFVCNYDNNGRSSYAGTYMYRSKGGLLVRMLVEILSRASKEDNGYYSIFDRGGNPGDVIMPEYYSHAKYQNGTLASYKGSVAYPTILSEPYLSEVNAGKTYFREGGYIHFLKKVSDEETMIISRRNRSSLGIATSFLSIFAIMFLMLTPLLRYSRAKQKENKKKNFKRQIRWTLTGIVALALAVLAFVSVKFVFDRNRIDSMNVMSEKISAIQTIMESRCQGVEHLSQVDKTEWMNLLQNVASTTKSDLSLFTPKGNVYLSTVAEMYELNLLDFRIDGEVYNKLINNHQRVCIHKEETDGKKYYALYAPILNKSGNTLAIVSTPFNRDGELMREALPHAILLIILLLAIIIITSTVASQIIARIFEPLSKVTKVMDAAGTEGLEKIEYSGEDEISTLVDAYNRMVEVIDESNKVLAQNERDKAWSAMARQVAHEIKNPLTPMNLEIQKLLLMKQRGNPLWTEKFEESARIVLEHISILTETANEFSTFAKLYTEDPVDIDLNRMLEDQISFFSNKENIEITYLGFKEAIIRGPKPQLIRVFVNLLTNATQAIENADGSGQIRVELRNGENAYEISVEDSGPGVPEENIEKLFTPNFTTKNSGTGLGLAISRNIVEKCNGSIGYKKSFNLGGACFTVRLPKTDKNA